MFEWDSLSWSNPTRYLWVVKSTTENMILVALRINLWISIVHINTNVYQNYGWVLVSFWFFLYPGQKNEMVLQPITVYCRWYIQSVVVKGRAVCLTELAVQCNQHVWKIWLWVFTYRVCFILGIICSFRIKVPIFFKWCPTKIIWFPAPLIISQPLRFILQLAHVIYNTVFHTLSARLLK